MSDRNLIKRETGHLVLNADGTPATYFAEGSISLELVQETVELKSLIFGVLDNIPVGRMAKLKFIPQEFSEGAAALLFPHQALALGGSIFGATDSTMDIHTTTGKRVRLSCVAVYKEPGIEGDIKKTVFGEVEYWGILGIGGDPNVLASFVNETSVVYPGASGFDRTKAITPAWVTTWGASPFNAIDLSEAGWKLTTKSQFASEDKVMGKGVIDIALKDYSMEVTFTPMNITRAQVMARMGMTVPLGGRMSSVAADFIATGTGIYIAARNMYLDKANAFQFDSDKRTTDALTLKSTKSITAGVRDEMLYLGEAAPA